MRIQNSAPASYYRGGTSRAIFFRRSDLPTSQSDWAPIFLSAIGSPDPNGRQLDGLGGGISSLSKVCVVSPSDRADADVEYTFIALGVKDSSVDFSSNCGNMTSAVGPFAVDAGLVESIRDGEATIRIFNTNSRKMIRSSFPVVGGEACAYGDFAIDGVAGRAARIKLDFLHPAGSRTGKLLPTGTATDQFKVPSGKVVRASCVDVGNPCVFVLANDFGVHGGITPDEIDTKRGLLAELEAVRRQAAVAMGLSSHVDAADMPGSVPKICMLAPSQAVEFASGDTQTAEETDLLARALSVGQPHRAIPLTVALALAAACKVDGTIASTVVRRGNKADPAGTTIGHAGGKIVVSASYDERGDLESSTVYRTARRLMEGKVFWR